MRKNKFTKYSKDRSGGFTLLGTLFSAFLAIIVIAAIVSLSSQVYGSSRNSRDRFIAVGLAKEGIELVRSIRDGNWLYYPQPLDIAPVTKMEWRGEAGNTSSCLNGACLKSLCNRSWPNYYTVDALSPDLGLVANGDMMLRIDSNGYYTHGPGTDPILPFYRYITIRTGGSSGDCGDTADSDPLSPTYSNPKPNPIIVTSIVYWIDSVGDTHSVDLEESLHDWITQRPQ